ncbi:hypothetical protein G7046_g1777 [Stylonectria norvegica]|nr:hypothetical protein G7046_g1777 [Stylonectria norvegica]
MSRNILITGASGYLGGTVVDQLARANLPSHGKIYALVRNDSQAEAVKKHGLEPLKFDAYDEASVEKTIVPLQISVVFWLIDASSLVAPPHFIKALAKVKKATGLETHFLHTSGAKIFADMAGAPVDRPLLDDDSDLYAIQKGQKSPYPPIQQAVDTNNVVVDVAAEYGVRSYIFVPCIVYGRGKGFGNQISIQTVAIVKAAQAAKKMYKVDADRLTWPVSHVDDTAALYVELLRAILTGEGPDYGRNGYYLAASGSVAWDDLYAAMAAALAKRGVLEDASVALADEGALEKMASGLGVPKEFVRVQLSGFCTFTAKHGEKIGWKSQYAASHILEVADEEVELILKNI